MTRRGVCWLIFHLLVVTLFPSAVSSTSNFQNEILGGDNFGSIERISVPPQLGQADGHSEWTTISRNGRFVAYQSLATNLVPNDTNDYQDIFLYDRLNRSTQRISLGEGNQEANNRSQFPDLSTDGRFVVFHSEATNLIPNDTNGSWDIIFRDLETGQVERISKSSFGNQANGASYFPDISGNGRYITFASSATNLSLNDTNGVDDIFVHDRQNGTTQRINLNADGEEANGFSTFPDISADGRYIVYESGASNLVPNDTNGSVDIFLYDTFKGVTERISLNSADEQGDGGSSYAVISTNNRYVTYVSHATNIDPDDPNPNGDIYLRDRLLNTTSLISSGMNNQPSDGDSHYPFLSGTGRFITYHSDSSNLVPDDTNNVNDIFLHDRQTGTTKQITIGFTGDESDGPSSNPAISDNGLITVFQSSATNLVEGDTNGLIDIFLYLDLTYRFYFPSFFR